MAKHKLRRSLLKCQRHGPKMEVSGGGDKPAGAGLDGRGGRAGASCDALVLCLGGNDDLHDTI